MNKQEYILNQLSQECIEVAKEISKALAFGLEDFNPNDKLKITNKVKIESELNDLLGAIDMAFKSGILDFEIIYNPKGRLEKINKIIKYMKRARQIGVLK